MSDLVPTIDSIINEYNRIIKGIDQTATEDQNRAYGGVIRSSKGTLVEDIAGNIIKIAWSRIAGDLSRISFAKNTVRVNKWPKARIAVDVTREKMNMF